MKKNILLDMFNLSENEFFSKKNALKIIIAAEENINSDELGKEFWHNFLDITRKSDFLQALDNKENTNRWADIVFKIIRLSDFRLSNMIEQRVKLHPERILFNDMSGTHPVRWTYSQIAVHIKEIAAFFYKQKPNNPRVALFLKNSVEGATVDLACLSYDIFNTPLNIHFSSKILSYIFDILDINFVVTDTPERIKIAKKAIENLGKDIKIITTKRNVGKNKNFYLIKECKKITSDEIKKILSQRKQKKLNRTATTMFTSGSTGMPKGVSFSIYNIVSKRFARAAALPQTGKKEKFICYLPLFHTFGRYLEMTGTIFWGGTYVMAGNPSAATLLSLFPKVNPTGFISVPIRWVQLYESCIKKIENHDDKIEKQKIIQSVIGNKLHWGLSAAGYLDPKIFRFFHKNGVSLNSGFGMTEATGGITMTPNYEYRKNSTGIPLPGIETRLKENNELELKGHYLGRYLEDAGPEDIIPYPEDDNYRMPTGDIFRIDKDKHHEIIDRVKDIYKNNKGQTVAPGMIEKKFAGVPGIKRTFLVGDGKPYNVLLIVPDNNDYLLVSAKNEAIIEEYFHQIVTSANNDLAPYERIINFTILENDFSTEKGELTPKGSFKRKIIENNFSELIKKLYKSNQVFLKKKDYTIIIPRWFYRDIGVLETDIELNETGLYNKITKTRLRINDCKEKDIYCIGDLAYKILDKKIDIGRIVRQPKLWVGNPELIKFSPCKESFDLPLKKISHQLSIPKNRIIYQPGKIPQVQKINDANLVFLNNIMSLTLHTEQKTALENLALIEQLFSVYDKNKIDIIRRRLEALARHPEKKIRVEAYRILLSKDPDPDFSEILPAFINSGKTFLDESSINKIANSNFDILHLESLRKRMHAYRTGLNWPANEETRNQFNTIFKMLLNFGINHPQYYKSIRAEFASWIILKKEPILAEKASKYFYKLYEGFENYITKNTPIYNIDDWNKRLIFDVGIGKIRQFEIKQKLAVGNFLKQSVLMTYDETNFDLRDVPDNGIWISRVRSYRNTKHYRMSINTKTGKHFDIHITFDDNLPTTKGLEMLYRNIALSGHPYDSPTTAQFGCSNPLNKIVTARYLSELSAWEKIRALAEVHTVGFPEHPNTWRKLFIRSMGVFFKAWNNSSREIMPGFVSPNNVVVPETDFSDNVKIISLSNWKKIDTLIPLATAILQNFYYKTIAHYPLTAKYLKKSWLFHACAEALGIKETLKILNQLKTDLKNKQKISVLETEFLFYGV